MTTQTQTQAQTTVFWELKTSTSKTIYIDFHVEGVSGVFRGYDPEGQCTLDKVLSHILLNVKFFNACPGIWDKVEVFPGWGGGWEWQERCHPLLAENYRLDSAAAWHTQPYGGDWAPDAKTRSMELLNKQGIYGKKLNSSKGVKLMKKWSLHRSPGMICYYFPFE